MDETDELLAPLHPSDRDSREVHTAMVWNADLASCQSFAILRDRWVSDVSCLSCGSSRRRS